MCGLWSPRLLDPGSLSSSGACCIWSTLPLTTPPRATCHVLRSCGCRQQGAPRSKGASAAALHVLRGDRVEGLKQRCRRAYGSSDAAPPLPSDWSCLWPHARLCTKPYCHLTLHDFRLPRSATLLGTLPDALEALAAAAATPGTSAWLSSAQLVCEQLCAQDFAGSQLFWRQAPLPWASYAVVPALASNGALLMVRAGCLWQAYGSGCRVPLRDASCWRTG